MRILSLDGGGYLGLATASFLAELERHFGRRCSTQFDLFCGTSTGAIIALALAKGLAASTIEALYQEFGPRVFANGVPGSRAARWVRSLFTAKYSNAPLVERLTSVFGDTTLGDVLETGKRVLIPAFCLTNGKPRIFKTDHASNLTGHGGYYLRDIALASSAAPIYLPAVALRSPTNGVEERFVDGGVFANHPALLGYAEAVSHLGVAPSNVQILSISTPRKSIAEATGPMSWLERRRLSRGALRWGSRVGAVFIDGTSEIMNGALGRIVAGQSDTRYERVVLPNDSRLEMDDASPKATETLRRTGSVEASQNELRNRVKVFFDEGGV